MADAALAAGATVSGAGAVIRRSWAFIGATASVGIAPLAGRQGQADFVARAGVWAAGRTEGGPATYEHAGAAAISSSAHLSGMSELAWPASPPPGPIRMTSAGLMTIDEGQPGAELEGRAFVFGSGIVTRWGRPVVVIHY